MNYIKLFEDFINISDDIFQEGDVFFHGTSLNHYLNIENTDFNVTDLYITTSETNAIEYAYQTSEKNNDSDSVLIVLNYELLEGKLIDDIHDIDYTNGEFDLKQDGQYIFNGNIKNAIFNVYNLVTKKVIINYKSI